MIREPWIRVHASLIDKPVVARMSDALGLSAMAAIGHLITFWGNVSSHATDGRVGELSDALLERWARWTKRPGAFAQWLRAQHTDADGRVNEWDEYQGKLESRRAKQRARMAHVRSTERAQEAHGAHSVRSTLASSAQSVATRARERDGTGRKDRPVVVTKSRSGAAAPEGAPHVGQAEEFTDAILAQVNASRALRGEPPLPA